MAAGVALAPPASADMFVMCPDGHEGVVGDHTSCGFAQVVRQGYFERGAHFRALSPVTMQWYDVDCNPNPVPARFVDGVTVSAVSCYASSNAQVVVW